ncbi:hypothetical protein PoB_000647900 [Plakobranchus ocellatus]|uniref:C-type lectin domain-containing protein n=1 Tax=Plakobranchus ocellatus TaxID=259542 RepID=A0AAV3YD36_9GAST|nr:hypothetical protein PoB_000647900 [Plakobranchus ocellatus]
MWEIELPNETPSEQHENFGGLEFEMQGIIRNQSEPTVFSGCGGWVHYPEIPTCLKVVHELKTWKEARAVCDKSGGDLVAILTPGLDAFLTSKFTIFLSEMFHLELLFTYIETTKLLKM